VIFSGGPACFCGGCCWQAMVKNEECREGGKKKDNET